ncbi:MAG TPA: prolyl oligopeptidase family serine peptidase [Steroidobacteraceae bacterium]|jgi:dipeptidyl aminopeptidase/acylaminoacyl peptidase
MPTVTRTAPCLLAAALASWTMAVAAAVPPPTSIPAATQAPSSGYDQPPQNVLDVMRAPSPPLPDVSPTRDTILLVSWEDYPPIARVATPFLRLAGIRIEPGNHSKHDTPGGYGITPCVRSFDLVHLPGGAQQHVLLPAGACPTAPVWSADGRQFAFENIGPSEVQLWIGDAQTGTARQVPGARLNPMFGDELQWLPNQKELLVKLVPRGIGPPPAGSGASSGANIQDAGGESGQSSTYENRDTLASKHDEDLFDYYGASQLAVVTAASGAIKLLGKPDRYELLQIAPDGQHLLVSTTHKPYSYVTTYDRFPQDVSVWDTSKRSAVVVHQLVSLPLADRVPIHGVPLGPREFSWRATEPATLTWAEALDRGDWNVEVPARDKVLLLKAPFDSAPVEIARTEQRFVGLDWSENPAVALMHEYDQNRHWMRVFVIDVDQPQSKPSVLWNLSADEKYANPGHPVHRVLANGVRVVRQDGETIYLAGVGSSPQGDRPFLDRLNLKTLKSERLFRSDSTAFEQFLSFLGADAATFLTWHQSTFDPPNAFLRSLGAHLDAASGEAIFASTSAPVTHIADQTPVVRQIKKRLVSYKRADGLDLSFTLYTPPGYTQGTRVPTILYAYPLDYADASKAGQIAGSQQTFTRLRQHRLLLLAGYALIDNASFPIVGDPKKAYDTYQEQLLADAKAAVDEAVLLGVADPDRIGVTGHSHGALMTVNLVAHSDLFRAGVATSGSYNKTLTPFGFQNERRSVWEAPDVYLKVSPFFVADKLKTPLLIVHGADDANPGTTPIQASKLYEAIRGNGGTARLVMLPHEPHWYTAMESNEQLIYEMLRWFDKYVKNAPPRPSPPH